MLYKFEFEKEKNATRYILLGHLEHVILTIKNWGDEDPVQNFKLLFIILWHWKLSYILSLFVECYMKNNFLSSYTYSKLKILYYGDHVILLTC